jgi:hypothetical protein
MYQPSGPAWTFLRDDGDEMCAELVDNGILYVGWSFHPQAGGGYGGGFQGDEQFLADGALHGMPIEMQAELRAAVLARLGTGLRLVVRLVVGDRPVTEVHMDVDGQPVHVARAQAPAVLFDGRVQAGRHTVGAVLMTDEGVDGRRVHARVERIVDVTADTEVELALDGTPQAPFPR